MHMETTSSSRDNIPEVVVSNKALHLAKEWVKGMTGGADCDLEEEEEDFEKRFEMRPARLGLGAKYISHSQVTSTINPVERKLREKLGSAKQTKIPTSERKASGEADKPESQMSMTENEGEDDEEGSRASFFNKKQRFSALNSHLLQIQSTNGSNKRKKR